MQRFRFVSVQIVHDQDYLFSILIVLGYIFYKIRPVWNFPVFSYFHHSLPNQWLTCHKNITCSLAFIFIINLFQSAKYCEELELSLLQSASVAIHPYKPQKKHNYRDAYKYLEHFPYEPQKKRYVLAVSPSLSFSKA